MNPSHDGRVNQDQAALFHHFNQIWIAQSITAIPPDI